jgi:SulP family sulfate permease
MEAIWSGIGSLSPSTVAISLASLGAILLVRRYRPTWPAFLIAVGIGSLLTALLSLDAQTIQTQFGGVPSGLPAPSLPPISLEKAWAVLPDAVTIALLAGVESLLSAVIADTMTGRRHRSNCELVAQGIANIGSVIFGGISATGALARTATNIRAGARGPVAGMLHALFLLLFMGVAAPVAGYFPLASLGAVLIVVAWGMSDAPGFAELLRVGSNGERFVLVATFLLTVLVDITVAIQVGVVLSVFLFMHRMAETVEVEARVPLIEQDQADSAEPMSRTRAVDEEAEAAHVVVFRIDGPFFFGAAAKAQTLLDEIGERPSGFVLDFSAVPLIDSSGAHAIAAFVDKAKHAGARVYFSGVRPRVRRTLKLNGMKPPNVLYAASVPYAIDAARTGRRAIEEGIVTT